VETGAESAADQRDGGVSDFWPTWQDGNLRIDIDHLLEKGLGAPPQYVEPTFGLHIPGEHAELVVVHLYPEGLNVEVGDNIKDLSVALVGWRDKRYVRQGPE